MNNTFRAAFVIGRRDFVATVFSRSFILFLLAPLFIFAFSLFVGQAAGRAEAEASRPVVAVTADSATVTALRDARARLVSFTSETSLPDLRVIPLEQDPAAQAQRLIADGEQNLSAVFSGTIERPVVTGPAGVDEFVGKRIALMVEEARQLAALEGAGAQAAGEPVRRVVTATAAGDQRNIRAGLARGSQSIVFMITLMLSTLLLSNLVEEKSNKVIEILAAAVPLDAVFIGKLGSMLAISTVGLLLWGGMLGFGFVFVQALQSWMALPAISPAIGWPTFALLMILYYAMNYLLLGALFLGIGGQANSIREIQTLSMPVTFLHLFVLILALNAGGEGGGWMGTAAYIVPFSSPLSMIAMAAESDALWPHLAALVWQALWVVLIVRFSSAMFRRTVLKSGGKQGFWNELKSWVR